VISLTLAAPATASDLPPAVGKLPPPKVVPLLSGDSADALAGSLRGYLVHNLPPVLYEASPGWGRMKLVARGVEWKGQGLRVRPQVQYSHKNDGVWRRIRARAVNPADTLVLDIRNARQPEPGKLAFDVFLSFDARVEADQQNWESGVRLYSGSARARFRARLLLGCELTARFEKGASVVPDAVVRLRVVRAEVGYDNLVVEHIAGIGGEGAQLLGDALKGGLRRWDPDLEPALLARANEALVRAGDSKEMRLSLGRFLK
jgi:hypothetical protein